MKAIIIIITPLLFGCSKKESEQMTARFLCDEPECSVWYGVYDAYIGDGQMGVDFEKRHILEAMEAYHAQSEWECEWNLSPLKHKWYAECDDDTPSVSQATMMFYNYCPFCGRKIKRI